MAKYLVSISRTATRFASIEVEARSSSEAADNAREAAGDIDFPAEQDATYTVECVVKRGD